MSSQLPQRYEFVVNRRLPPLALAVFNELAARHDGRDTVLSGLVRDQPHLVSLLESFDELGVTVDAVPVSGSGIGAIVTPRAMDEARPA